DLSQPESAEALDYETQAAIRLLQYLVDQRQRADVVKPVARWRVLGRILLHHGADEPAASRGLLDRPDRRRTAGREWAQRVGEPPGAAQGQDSDHIRHADLFRVHFVRHGTLPSEEIDGAELARRGANQCGPRLVVRARRLRLASVLANVGEQVLDLL